MVYPYKRNAGLQLPFVTFAVQHQQRWFAIEAYVDSGAAYSVFASAVADRIRLDFRSGRRVLIQVGDGGLIPVFLHDLEVQIGQHRFTAPVGFSDRLGIRFGVLGRSGVFDRFRVCFDEKRLVVTLAPLE
jgi:hypothetical protein